MAVDLHLHTHHSDGRWSPGALVERAIELKLECIAITDHDTMDGVDEAIACAAGRLEIIPGIEINTVWKEPDGFEEDVHILGYFPDRQCAELKSLLKRQQEARVKLVEDTITRLKDFGIMLTFADVQNCAGIGSIGRPHITAAIVAAGGAADVAQAYSRFMLRSSPHYVHRQSVTPVEAIKAITASGGVASIAHPGKTPRILDIILKLKSAGLGGIECYHGRHSLDLVKHYIRLANRNQLLITGGSDCHGPQAGYKASIGSISVPGQVVHDLKQAVGLHGPQFSMPA